MKTSRNDVVGFLERLGQAISAGDLQAISACSEVPALVLSDEGAVAVAATSEIERFFQEAGATYREQGLVATKPQLERFDELSERMLSADVRWPAFDSSGAEKSTEHSHYILRIPGATRAGDQGVDEPGRLRIRVGLTMTGRDVY